MAFNAYVKTSSDKEYKRIMEQASRDTDRMMRKIQEREKAVRDADRFARSRSGR